MPRCETCSRTFGTQEACKQHMTEKGHQKPRKKCDQCNKLFQDQSAAEAHMTKVGHWSPKIPCETCVVKFPTHEAANQHMTAKNHYKNYCKPCKRRFSNENDLKMHFNSKAHRRTQDSDPIYKTVASNVDSNIEARSHTEGFQMNETMTASLNLKHVRPGAVANIISPQPIDYTVGWICALPKEMAAAEEMLDKIYQTPPQHRQDENNYVVGQIAHLKIVVGCLPSGHVGTTSAAMVAGHMRQTFTALEYFLLVGVGGGLPSENSDVRLGDVVISQRVIQYDYGKAITDSRFELTGHLNRPPNVLLNAVSRLASQEATGSSALVWSILGHLAHIEAKYPDSENNWSHPGVENDQLFNSDYYHEGNTLTCAGCDPARLEFRPPRGSNWPKFHYGTIASANRVMRDGAARERLRKETNALCVEMEAAGLMNNFPCLVIRGICDYADSHKNKGWQQYAAAIAAAYAKELLSIMPKHI
ncbi:MTA/SAH nucleosidase [Fusarium sp. Ph1]|nr:MTA/SAH nucleosidase [Fusarium sp. Ph1]